jgi:glycosyltransferase involved in cell wall biosynthesis
MVNYEYPPLGGGSGNATLHTLREIARGQDMHVDLVTSGTNKFEESDSLLPNVNIHRIRIAKKDPHFWTTAEILEWFVRAVGRSRQLFRDNRYDLCHCWGGWPSGLVGWLHSTKVPYAIALRGSDVPGYNTRLRVLDPILLRPVSRMVWRNAAIVTCVSRGLRDLARNTEPDIPYEVIHNGVDCVRFHPGASPERFSILFVGRLIQRKGVIDLIKAFRLLALEEPSSVLHLVGGGPDRAHLEAYCRKEGIDRRVIFHGAVDAETIPELYRSASVFVMPSIEEAMSNATLEAMASGLPIITTRTGSSEIIDGNGTIVAREPELIAAAIRRYRDDSAFAHRHGRRSREIAQTMSWATVAHAYRQAYRRILGLCPAEAEPVPALHG